MNQSEYDRESRKLGAEYVRMLNELLAKYPEGRAREHAEHQLDCWLERETDRLDARFMRAADRDPDYGGAFDGNTVSSDADGGL